MDGFGSNVSSANGPVIQRRKWSGAAFRQPEAQHVHRWEWSHRDSLKTPQKWGNPRALAKAGSDGRGISDLCQELASENL